MKKALCAALVCAVLLFVVPVAETAIEPAVPALSSGGTAYAVVDYEDCCANGDGWCCSLLRLQDWWHDFWHGDGGWDW